MEKKEKKKLFSKFLLKKIFFNFNIRKKPLFVFKKNLTIFSFYKNNNFYVYNGNVFRVLNALQFFVCLSFGIFVFTRKPFKFLLKKKKR